MIIKDYISISELYVTVQWCGLHFTLLTVEMWLERDAKQETSLRYSCKAHLSLGNKKLRAHQYQSDLPVLLTASSVAWLHTVFLWAVRVRGHLCEKLRAYLCERTDACFMPMQVWLTYIFLDAVCQGWLMLLNTCGVCVSSINERAYSCSVVKLFMPPALFVCS